MSNFSKMYQLQGKTILRFNYTDSTLLYHITLEWLTQYLMTLNSLNSEFRHILIIDKDIQKCFGKNLLLICIWNLYYTFISAVTNHIVYNLIHIFKTSKNFTLQLKKITLKNTFTKYYKNLPLLRLDLYYF